MLNPNSQLIVCHNIKCRRRYIHLFGLIDLNAITVKKIFGKYVSIFDSDFSFIDFSRTTFSKKVELIYSRHLSSCPYCDFVFVGAW